MDTRRLPSLGDVHQRGREGPYTGYRIYYAVDEDGTVLTTVAAAGSVAERETTWTSWCP